jgi:hypothetical protein
MQLRNTKKVKKAGIENARVILLKSDRKFIRKIRYNKKGQNATLTAIFIIFQIYFLGQNTGSATEKLRTS